MTSTNSNFLKLQASNSFVTKKFEFAAVSEPMANPEKGGRFAPTAIRMRAIRRASIHPTPKAFCEFLGISVSRLSNVENGLPIGRGLQDIIITKLPWVSRSFLMDGDVESLTGHTRQLLAPLVAEESNTTLPRSRSKAGGSAR
jgi:hypothetical protein